jgi:hypothetical protein
MTITNANLAKNLVLPDWATHVAVRNDGSKAEPAAWLEDEKEYTDEDPSKLKKGDWAGVFNERYWSFYSKEELTDASSQQAGRTHEHQP